MRLMFFLITFCMTFEAMSHQTSRTATYKELKWNYTNIPLWISRSSSTLGSAPTIIDQSLNEWSQASGFKMFRSHTGNNQIIFSNNFSKYGSAVVGVTEVSYSKTGNINSATILLNEDNYRFVATPGMPTGNNINLKDVVTHELGHFAGLGHSEVLDSTMFYQTFSGQSELAADDKAGIRNKYESGHGKISGYMKGGNHIGVFGVSVQAISRRTGEAISTISDDNGYFEVGGLDINDSYYIHTSKLKNLSALPSYLANAQTEFCPSSYRASFFSQCGNAHHGIPEAVNLSHSRREVHLGEVTINCSLRIQEEYLSEKLKTVFDSYEIFNFQHENRFEKSYVGYFKPSVLDESKYSDDVLLPQPNSDKFIINLSGLGSPLTKSLRLRLVSQPLGNPIEFKMIVKRNSAQIPGSPFTRTLRPDGTLKLDLMALSALQNLSSSNVFEIEIAARKLTQLGTYLSIPDSMNFSSAEVSPYLLIMSLEENLAPLLDSGSNYSDNSSCLEGPYTYAVTKSTARSDESLSDSSSAAPLSAACGTIDPPSGPSDGGNFMGLLSLGFMLSLFAKVIAKRGKNFLS